MSLTAHTQQNVDSFFSAIAPFAAAYQNDHFAFIALRTDAGLELVQARVFLNSSIVALTEPPFDSSNVVAAHCFVSDLNLDCRTLVTNLLKGELITPYGTLLFPKAPNGAYAAIHTPFHPEGLEGQRRFNTLAVLGGPTKPITQPDLDWEVKSASTPYEGVAELVSAFGLRPLQRENIANIEVVAFHVALVDAAQSTLNGSTGTIHVLLSKGLNPHNVTLGHRSYLPGTAPVRGTVSGESFTWTDEDAHQRGVVDFEIREGSVLNCTASYEGIAQHHWWLLDPTKQQNPRRAAYETFDPNLDGLKDIIVKALRRGEEARDLEAAISWLLWMLGFSAAQLGGTRRTQDAADIVVTAPNGHFAVIECTTGILKADNKLPLLHDRAIAVKRSLESSNHNHFRVLPILVTSKMREEIKPDLEQAERLGIVVLTREDLLEAINRTARLPTADQLFEEAFKAAETAKAKYDSQPSLPLPSPVIGS